ncbi:MAG TPA: phospho-sugar mutase [Acidimicrobiales bacterium]|nr:phospho-sugar mutase [Acidimicrobiales bacterium]
MREDLRVRVAAWVAADPDDADRAELGNLLDAGNEVELSRRFDAPLNFGTAGLRGPVMAGPAGMNRLTVRRATQGVIAWLAETGADPTRGVVVGRDARNGSERFNDEVVAVLLGAGVVVWEMPRPAPTPFVPYCVKALGAAAGIMITASHNPPRDNGYKLYAGDGAQIIPPNDEIVERHAAEAGTPTLGKRGGAGHHVVEASLLATYRDHMVERFGVDSDLAIAYTALHGVGGAPMTELFAAAGFDNVHVVASQFAPDPSFPTLPFPNPEEPGALDEAMRSADAVGADLIIANDPDADRLGVAVRDKGSWRPLRGDEIGWLLASALLPGASPGDVVATTIVSSGLLEAVAADAGIRYVTTLTGFKWISRAAGDGVLRFGYEEALGFAVDPMVADKDGLSAALCLARLAHGLALEGQTLVDRLDEIETRFGVHAGTQVSVRAEGAEGLAAIAEVVARLRSTPPAALGGLAVTDAADLSEGWRGLPPTEGVRWQMGEVGRVVVRPSGTEPKLKAYLEVVQPPTSSLADARSEALKVLDAVRRSVEELTAL